MLNIFTIIYKRIKELTILREQVITCKTSNTLHVLTNKRACKNKSVCYTYARPESFLISLTIRRKYYLLLLRLLLFLLNLVVFPFSADVHILAVLVADRSTLAAKHLARPQPDRWPRILVPGRWIDVPTKIDFRSGQRALPLLEIAESGRDCRQFVAIRIRYRFRGLYAAR